MNQIELPAICSKCLGHSYNLTLFRDLKGSACKFCTRPFATYSWRKAKTGPTEKTRFCLSCADRKNVCQSCYRNFATGLPLSVHESANLNKTNTAPSALKYAAIQAESQEAFELTKSEYQLRIAEQNRAISLGQQNLIQDSTTHDSTLDHLQTILTLGPDHTDVPSFLIANVDPDLNTNDLEAAINNLGQVERFSVYPEARCGFVVFTDNQQSDQAFNKLVRGILMVNGHKLRLLRTEPFEIGRHLYNQVSSMILRFMRGKMS